MKDFFIRILLFFNPRYWLMSRKYSKTHDQLLLKLMNRYEFSNIERFTAKLGDVEIRFGNYAYAVGIRELYNHSRPSRLTIYKMFKKLRKETPSIDTSTDEGQIEQMIIKYLEKYEKGNSDKQN